MGLDARARVRFPFVRDTGAYVVKHGPPPAELVAGPSCHRIRERAVARLRESLSKAPSSLPNLPSEDAALDELLAMAMTRMLLACLADRTLNMRYASKEANRVLRDLRTKHNGEMTFPKEDLLLLAEELELELQLNEGLQIPVTDFLQVAGKHDELKLPLFDVQNGFVNLTSHQAAGVIAHAHEQALFAALEAERERGAPIDLQQALAPYLDQLMPELQEARKHWDTGDLGPVVEQAFPPCIKQLFADMRAQVLVPHHGRFAFASFLGNIGMTADQILDYMSQLPNFSRSKSEYQIKHITGEGSVEKYTPPGCQTLQSQGVCPLAQRDEICEKIKHPLSYYRMAKRGVAAPVEDARST